MVGRRLLLLVAVLMGVTALAASIVPRQNDSPGPTTAPGRPPLQPTATAAPSLEPAAPTSGPQEDTLDETLSAAPGASPMRVRARLGQTLILQVEGAVFDVVVVGGLDQVKAIAPEAPAHFDIFVDRTGRFPITLQDAGRRLGEIVVRE